MTHSPEPLPYHSAQEVTRWLVLTSPGSSGYADGQRRLGELAGSSFGNRLVVVPPIDDPQANQENLLTQLEAGDGIVALVGDGGFHHLVNNILNNQDVARLRPVLLAAGAGNGNDIAKSYARSWQLRSLASVMRLGRISRLYPLQTRFASEMSDHTDYTVGYVSFGGTGYGASLFDDDSHRNHRWYDNRLTRLYLEARLVHRTIKRMHDFPLIDAAGVEHQLSELVIADYPRMAKLGSWPVDYGSHEAYVSEVGSRSYGSALQWLGQLAAGNVPGGRALIPAPSGQRLAVEPGDRQPALTFHLPEPTYTQSDGEWHTTDPHTTVTIRRSTVPFYAVTTN